MALVELVDIPKRLQERYRIGERLQAEFQQRNMAVSGVYVFQNLEGETLEVPAAELAGDGDIIVYGCSSEVD